MRLHPVLPAAVLAIATFGPAKPASATPTITVHAIAKQSQPAPDANGFFPDFTLYGPACVNDSGQVVFSTRLQLTSGGTADNDALVRGRPGESPVILAREGQPIPDGTGAFGQLHTGLRYYAMNDSGRVALTAGLTGTPAGAADNAGVYSVRDPGLFWVHARRGDIAPFTTSALSTLTTPQINEQPPAAVSFFGALAPSSVAAVVYVSRLGLLSPVSWLTQSAPDSEGDPDGFNGILNTYPTWSTQPAALRRNAAEVALSAHLAGTTNASLDDDGIFRASADGFAEMARGHNSAPGGGLYQEFGDPVYNANGVAAFTSDLEPCCMNEILALDWPGGGDVVAYSTQPAADGNGTFARFSRYVMNNHEAVAFRVDLVGTVGGGLDDSAIYKGDSTLLVVPPLEDQLAREGQPVPDGDGEFTDFFNTRIAINDAGQVAFTAQIRNNAGGSTNDRGVYLWDPTEGLVKLLREGDLVDGLTVQEIVVLNDPNLGGNRWLNERGEVAVRLDLSGFGGDGVYLIRFEPTSTVGVPAGGAPRRVALAAGPNPARGEVTIRWARVDDSPLSLEVLDVAGRPVRALALGAHMPSGEARWDGRDGRGRTVPAGIYFVRAHGSDWSRTVRVVRMP